MSFIKCFIVKFINVLKKIKEETLSVAKVELEPKLEGRQAVMILAPEDKTNK